MSGLYLGQVQILFSAPIVFPLFFWLRFVDIAFAYRSSSNSESLSSGSSADEITGKSTSAKVPRTGKSTSAKVPQNLAHHSMYSYAAVCFFPYNYVEYWVFWVMAVQVIIEYDN